MKNTNIILGIIVGLIIIIIGIVIFAKRPISTTETKTTTTVTETVPIIVAPDTNPVTTTTTPAASKPSAAEPSANPSSNAGIPVAFTSPDSVVTETTATVKGAVTPTGSFTNYWYEYGTTANLGKKTASQMVGSGYSAIGAPGHIVGLVKDTTYYYQLIAENQYGRVNGLKHTFKTVRGVTAPTGGTPIVKTQSPSKVASSSANLNGDVNPNRSQSDYWFEYGTTNNLGRVTQFLPIGSNNTTTAVSISVTDLTPGTVYYFRLNAQNAFGTVNGSILNFKTTGTATNASAAPIATTTGASNVTASTARLTGVINPNNAETSYWFEYGRSSGLFKRVTETTRTTTNASSNSLTIITDVSKLSSRTTYYLQMVAKNKSGTTRGEKASFTTQ